MRWLLPVTFAILLAPSHGNAQASHHSILGLGVAVNSNLDIRLPLRIASRWRLEPGIGVVDAKTTATSVGGGVPAQPRDVSRRYWRLSLLLGRLIAVDSTFTLYCGPRFALVRNSQTQQVYLGLNNTRTRISYNTLDKEFGLITGAEAALGRHFTVGGEVGLSYTLGGDPSVDYSSMPQGYSFNVSGGGHTLNTSAAVVVRWFPGGMK